MLRSLVIACAVAGITAAAGAPVAQAAELPRIGGMYTSAGQPLAMLDSKIVVTVRGPIVEAVITQRFHNRAYHATEATYIFPLPPDAAVSAMSITSGPRTIRASIERREEAQRRYEAAIRAGVAAALLDQERPDIFTQTVAAIPPRSTVEVTLRFDTTARYVGGTWELVLPMVVAPRYVPGAATARPTTGAGRAPDTDRAPDASRVTPAGSPGAGGATEVSIHFVDPATDVTSPTHELTVAGRDATLIDPKSDHDAVIRWRASASAAGWVEHGADGGYAAVVIEAPPAPARRPAIRCTLVLDRSASARGDADAIAKPLVRHLLGALNGADRIAVAGTESIAWSPPADVARVLDRTWQTKPAAFDLTRVLGAVRPDRAPLVLVTGGLVADDRAAIAAARKLGVPVHVIGVGPAPARALLTQIAAVTGGTVRFGGPGDDLVALATATLADVASPPAPVTVTWGTLAASEVVPGTLPRLGAGQAMLVLARVKRAQTANARARGELFSIEILPAPRATDGATTPMGPLARRWARSRLDELLAGPPNVAAVTALALRFGLVSPYTSMVAIGDEVIVQGGTRRSIAVPVSVPAGMRWQAVKKEITVDSTTSSREPIVTSGALGKTITPTAPAPAPRPVADDEDEAASVDQPATASLDNDAIETRSAMLSGSAAGEMISISSMHRRGRLRISTSVGGGLVRASGESGGLLALGTRLEIGDRSMFGLDASLWLLDGFDAEGRVLASFARRGLARWAELGLGLGLHLGDGAEPAAALSLRLHVPAVPRAAGYLRYDGALIYGDAAVRGEHAFTLGVEWGF